MSVDLMKMNYRELKGKPKTLQSLTGLNPEEFSILLKSYRLSPLLNQALGYEECLPEREPSQLEAVLTQCPSLEFIIDGTERRINRPKNKESQNENYSGKKNAHTVKNNIITDMNGKVLF